jgi:Dolichyl-phosphate-mannose-protein mannosyltransferase
VFRLQADSDESQHLHLIYGWLNGELPYRDRFDNHTPLLYLLFLPLAALAGETPHIILLARIAEFPISLAILALIYLIARRLTDRQVALWTVATVLALADWSLKSLEFRPDVLWSFCWFLAIWVLVEAPDSECHKVLCGRSDSRNGTLLFHQNHIFGDGLRIGLACRMGSLRGSPACSSATVRGAVCAGRGSGISHRAHGSFWLADFRGDERRDSEVLPVRGKSRGF